MSRSDNPIGPELQERIEETFGSIRTVTMLQGVAGESTSMHVVCEFGQAVLKVGTNPIERNFYEGYAKALREKGVATPVLYHSGSSAELGAWLLLEYIPKPFPEERFRADPQQLRALFQLHQQTWAQHQPLLDAYYTPVWSESMTETLMDWFARSTERDSIRNSLEQARLRFHGFPLTDCCISGDANQTNWRIREDGEVVLLDWERFGYGTPAFDLAVTIPGLGSEDSSLERMVARRYLEYWKDSGKTFPYQEDTLVEQIRLAKLFTIVEFITQVTKRPNAIEKSRNTVRFLVQTLPLQLATLLI